MEEQNQVSSLRDFLVVLFKYKYTIMALFLIIVAAVAIVTFFLPPTYEAKSSLLVKFGREYIYRSEVGERISDSRPLIPVNQQEAINSEIRILTSQDLFEKVISTIKIENIYPDLTIDNLPKITPLQASILKFEKKLSIESIIKSNVIEISFRHDNPQIAAKAVNLLVDFFMEKHLQVYSGPKSSFLMQQLTFYAGRMKDTQNKLEAYKQQYQVFSLEEQRTLLLKQRSELDTAYKIAHNQVSELQEKLASLKNQIQAVSPEVPLYTETERYTIVDDGKYQLLTLKIREQDLLAKYKETNSMVINIRKEIKTVEEFVKKQEEELKGIRRTGQNTLYQDVERGIITTKAELSSQLAKDASLREQIAQLDQEIQTLDLRENDLQDIRRELAANEKNYKTYSQTVEEARISDALNLLKMTNVSVIQAAFAPAKPIRPIKELNIALGIIIGAVFSLAVAFFCEYLNQGFSAPQSAARRLGLPILGAFPLKR